MLFAHFGLSGPTVLDVSRVVALLTTNLPRRLSDALDEVDSRSMQSKLVTNLVVAGEILDLDGPIGGYNFQAALSTGWLTGERAAD